MRNAFLYEILEISPTARPAVIKAAYRCLAQEYHPDRNPGDAEAAARMALINHAYSVLGDPQHRLRYDEKMAVRALERRGSGPASTPRSGTGPNPNPNLNSNPGPSPSLGPGQDRPSLRPFAFRPLK